MEGETVEHVRLSSNNINGAGDAGQIEADLGALPGVERVKVDPGSHLVEVRFDPRVVNLNRIKEAMQASGYPLDSETFAAQRDDAAGQR